MFSLQHLTDLLDSYGVIIVGMVIGLESVGLPLPGETLLIAAAVLAGTTHQLNVGLVVSAASLGAIIGQAVGYGIGRALGVRLLAHYGRYIGITERRLTLGRALFARHGVKLVFAARFVVLLRTLAAVLAGANRMPWGRFMLANVTGSLAWSTLYGFGGYFLGHEATHLAGPVAICIAVTIAAGLLIVAFYARRREQQLLLRRSPADQSSK